MLVTAALAFIERAVWLAMRAHGMEQTRQRLVVMRFCPSGPDQQDPILFGVGVVVKSCATDDRPSFSHAPGSLGLSVQPSRPS